MAIIDSSALIALGSIGKLEIIKKSLENITITEQVYAEATAKSESNEAISVKKAVEDVKWIKVQKSNEINQNLGIGEASSISLAYELKQPLITDDKKAAFIASTLGIECHGTIYLILLALKKKILKNNSEAIAILNELIASRKLYLSSEVIAEFYYLLNQK